MGKLKRNTPVVVERQLIYSPAFLKLTGKAPQVLFLFLSKRQFARIPKGAKKVWEIINNEQIVFTYEEAKSKYGISYRTFSRAIEQLVSHGFIDIARPGIGVGGFPTLYAISERWRQYGTENFDAGKRVKRKAHRFPKGSANPRHTQK